MKIHAYVGNTEANMEYVPIPLTESRQQDIMQRFGADAPADVLIFAQIELDEHEEALASNLGIEPSDWPGVSTLAFEDVERLNYLQKSLSNVHSPIKLLGAIAYTEKSFPLADEPNNLDTLIKISDNLTSFFMLGNTPDPQTLGESYAELMLTNATRNGMDHPLYHFVDHESFGEFIAFRDNGQFIDGFGYVSMDSLDREAFILYNAPVFVNATDIKLPTIISQYEQEIERLESKIAMPYAATLNADDLKLFNSMSAPMQNALESAHKTSVESAQERLFRLRHDLDAAKWEVQKPIANKPSIRDFLKNPPEPHGGEKSHKDAPQNPEHSI